MTDPDPVCRPSSLDLTKHQVLCPFANKSKVMKGVRMTCVHYCLLRFDYFCVYSGVDSGRRRFVGVQTSFRAWVGV